MESALRKVASFGFCDVESPGRVPVRPSSSREFRVGSKRSRSRWSGESFELEFSRVRFASGFSAVDRKSTRLNSSH